MEAIRFYNENSFDLHVQDPLICALYGQQTEQALQLISRMSTTQLAQQDARGQTALHHAVSASCDSAVITALVEAMPDEAIAIRDWCRQSALDICAEKGAAANHYALILAGRMNGAGLPLVQAMQSHNEALALGLFPMYLDRAFSGASRECAQLLPMAVEHRCEALAFAVLEAIVPYMNKGNASRSYRWYHLAEAAAWAINRGLPKIALAIIAALPKEALTYAVPAWRDFGSVVTWELPEHPKVQRVIKTKVHCQPLLAHACQSNIRAIVAAVLDKSDQEEYANAQGVTGHTPLLSACIRPSPVTCEELIQRLPPEALMTPNRFGKTPLHRIAEGQGYIIKRLVEAAPQEALSALDDEGLSPLDHQLLFKHWKNALAIIRLTPAEQLRPIPSRDYSPFMRLVNSLIHKVEPPIDLIVALREQMLPMDFYADAERARELLLEARRHETDCASLAELDAWLEVLSPPLEAKAAE